MTFPGNSRLWALGNKAEREFVPARYVRNSKGQLRFFPGYWRMTSESARSYLVAIKRERQLSMNNDSKTEFFQEWEKADEFRGSLKSLAVSKAFLTSDRQLKNYERADWTGVSPPLAAWAANFCLWMARREIPVFVLEAYRSNERQAQLYASGKSKIESNGPHGRGCAVDIIHSVRGYDLSPEEWRFFEAVGLRLAMHSGIALTWGGSWGWDCAHWELKDWKSISPFDPGKRRTPLGLLKEIGYPNMSGTA